MRVMSAAEAPPPCLVPLAGSSVIAGFPSPATGHMEGALDLNALMVRRPHATFFVRVTGESMRDAGIYDGDLLVVDRAETPRNGSIVLAVLDGEFTVKRWRKEKGVWMLQAEHPDYPPIAVSERAFEIWGVVTYAVRALVPCSR
jgi:DNA polymerase V